MRKCTKLLTRSKNKTINFKFKDVLFSPPLIIHFLHRDIVTVNYARLPWRETPSDMSQQTIRNLPFLRFFFCVCFSSCFFFCLAGLPVRLVPEMLMSWNTFACCGSCDMPCYLDPVRTGRYA